MIGKLKDAVAGTAIRLGLRAGFKLPSGLPLPLPVLREAMERAAVVFRPRPEAKVEPITLGGVPGERITVPGARRAILHFHGGAFFAGSTQTHRAMASEFAVRAEAEVFLLNYRLAPEHPYPAALDDGFAAWLALLAKGYAPSEIVLGGDSGGCAHALNLVLNLRDLGQALPAGLFMISPFLDMRLSNPSVHKLRRRDPMLTAKALRRGADGHAGGIAADDIRVSPGLADLHGLPPVLVQVGGAEILLDDARLFAQRAAAVGVSVECQVFPGMWHNFQMFNAVMGAADEALEDIGGFVKRVGGGVVH